MRVAATILCAWALAACDSPSLRTNNFQFGSSNTLATTGNLRLVTERLRPGPDGSLLPIVCTEPSPDYAVAFGSGGKAAVNVNRTEGVSGGGTAEFTRTEEVKELSGRNAAVLALRDGLYAACQAYSNGVIGHDAYALILSQYGTLLVALAGQASAQDKGDPAKRAAASAMLVACLSGQDPTRLPQTENRLLTPAFCRRVLDQSLRHALART